MGFLAGLSLGIIAGYLVAGIAFGFVGGLLVGASIRLSNHFHQQRIINRLLRELTERPVDA